MEIVILVTYKYEAEDGSIGDGHETVHILEPFEAHELSDILKRAIFEDSNYENVVFTSITDVSSISSHSKYLSEVKQRS